MILHIDMDAFFAAIEQRDNPELRNKPVIVAGFSKRSVVSTASYGARKFGIHSAMPVFQARQLCPEVIIVPGNREKYAAESKKIMAIICGFSPLVEQVSIDEAYVDISGCEKLFGPPLAMAQKIQAAILKDLFLTCSIGIAPVKFLAKIASDLNKPNGITHISKDKMDNFIADLPIARVPGVGKQAAKQMELLQIRTLGDVRKFDTSLLNRKFGKMGARLYQLAYGIDETCVETEHIRKSISSETTLSEDISDADAAGKILLAHAQRVGRDLRKKQMKCCNVSIKIKFSDFTQITRSKRTDTWICSSTAIFNAAISLYRQVELKKKIRLLGVGVSHFQDMDTPVQMELLSLTGERTKKQWESVDRAVDSIQEKFGSDMVKKASLNIQEKKNMSETIGIKVNISGRVQGVFFRAQTQTAARQLTLSGYVKNLSNGSVEAVFQGDKQAVSQMVEWCRKGPPGARVDRVLTESVPPMPDCDSFEIRY
ncbi:MAG: DNA polymerase IV [Proteobacteria bacterium]|nr:DNA polymerase IV [Pseudomonadota bacterium]MBU4130670.1 DNA polymerase IV [Pseudomonadota bacterium]